MQIVERHFTLDKHQKGTDHALSLLPHEFASMVQAIRCIERSAKELDLIQSIDEIQQFVQNVVPADEFNAVKLALQESIVERKILPCEIECQQKLGKSLVYVRNLEVDHQLTEFDLCAKVAEPNGMAADKLYDAIGSKLLVNVVVDTPVFENQFIKINNNN